MELKLKLLATLSVLILWGCDGGGSGDNTQPKTSEVIKKITISETYYPTDFKQSLQDNLDYFLDGVGVSATLKVPYDHVFVNGEKVTPANYVNIATVGLYINLLVEMAQHGDEDAINRLASVLKQFEQIPNWNGLFYWLYEIKGNTLKVSPKATVSAVDNGIVSFSLAGLFGAFYDHNDSRLMQLAKRAQALLERQVKGWQSLYDPERGLLRAGWSKETNSLLGYHIDRKSNESRLATLWAVMAGKGVIPQAAFDDMELITEEYTLNGDTISPMLTWDGSFFQAMLPSLWLDEASLIPEYQMVIDFTSVHKAYADLYQIPFVSASATVNDSYLAYGLEDVSESARRFNNHIETGVTGSPHTLGLYYLIEPQDAVKRLNALKSLHPQLETSAGWADAIDSNGRVSTKVIGLDQGMFTGAFFAKAVRSNVSRYIEYQGYEPLLHSMYQGFIPSLHISK